MTEDSKLEVMENGESNEETTSQLSPDEILKEEVLRFSATVSNPSVRQQRLSYAALIRVLERAENLPEPLIKGLVKVSVSAAVKRFTQPESWQTVWSLLDALSKHNCVATARALAAIVSLLFPAVPNVSPPLAGGAVWPSKWQMKLLEKTADKEDAVKAAVNSLSHLAFYVSASKQSSKVFAEKLKKLNKVVPTTVLVPHVVELAKEPTAADRVLALLSFIDEVSPVPSTAALFCDAFAKTALLAKQKPLQTIVDRCVISIRRLTEKEFTDALFPNVKKGMLRSPEIALAGVSAVFGALQFALDSFVDDVVKGVQGCLSSAEQVTREQAVQACVALAVNSLPTATLKVVNRFFDAIVGAKSSDERADMLAGIAKCAKTKTANGSDLDAVATKIVDKLAANKGDVTEQMVTAQWDALSAWISRLSDPSRNISTAVQDAGKLTPALRSIAYRAINNVLTNRNLSALPAVCEKQLVSQLDASKEPLEAAGISLLLIKGTDGEAADKGAKNAAGNEALLKDKSLGAMSGENAVMWAELVEALLLRQGDAPALATRALCLLLLFPAWQVRARATLALDRTLRDRGCAAAVSIAETLYRMCMDGEVEMLIRKTPGCAADWCPPGEWVVQVLRKLLPEDESKQLSGDKQAVAVAALLPSMMPRVVLLDGSVWLRWLHENAMSLLSEQPEFVQQLKQRVLECKERVVRDHALLALVQLHNEPLRKELWAYVEEKLGQLETAEYTRVHDKQIAVWKCAAGQLFNTDVLDCDNNTDFRPKRENKCYSYAEQMMELELIRELAEKRRREGKLTPKQKAAMEKELAAEKVVRDELQALYTAAEERLDEARALVAADPKGAFQHTNIIYKTALPLVKSSLVSEQAARLFLAFRDAAFPQTDDYLHELVGHCSLRTVGSKWSDGRWAEEPLPAAMARMLKLTNEKAFVVETGEDSEEDEALLYEDCISATQLSLLFPLLRAVLTKEDGDEAVQALAVQLLQAAINKKLLRDHSVMSLPVVELCQLVLWFGSSAEATLARPALAAHLQTLALLNETGDTGAEVVTVVEETLEYLKHESVEVREHVLRALSAHQLITRLVLLNANDKFAANCLVRLFVARHDGVESVAEAAAELWDVSVLSLRASLAPLLVDEAVSPIGLVRDAAARAIISFLDHFSDQMPALLTKLNEVYSDLLEIRPAVFDDVGRKVQEAYDEWDRRLGVGTTLGLVSEVVEEKNAQQLLEIVVPKGLSDQHASCRTAMREAAVNTIIRHGNALMPKTLPFLENLLDATPAGQAADNQRQGLVVLLGTIAQFIDPKSNKVRAIVTKLMEALSTPSQQVQESASRCLAPLVPAIGKEAKELVVKLQWTLFEADSYGERRGAAYGIAGLVKGMGMIQMKELDLLAQVEKNMLEKKQPKKREGGLLALEILCSTIGKLFEPYIVKALPSLLASFGDGDRNVQKSAADTGRAMMSMMSKYGLKLVLPSIIAAIDDDQWRTKCAAVDLLGSMAFCAPKQLSACLPSIVPKLIEVLADSHTKVQASGENALRQIARVIRNPEILGVSNQIIVGLLDPANKTSHALQTILNTKFIHYIDPPSLALIMPVVRRAFEDRNSETRRVAAQIIANIYILAENKDMEPYLPELVPGLQKSLLDPVPEIRTVAAKALGAIVSKSSGETSVHLRETIIPWLKERLVSPISTVDRSGAAQGLAEVLAGVGSEQLEYVMPEIIAATESTEVSAETRDGYILMYIYLPMVFGEKFVPYLPQVVPPILKALADENEYVRASALKAGQRLISMFMSQARRLLLPQLQTALFDDNWRIRHAAVQLLGDFLFNISGITGKSTSDTAGEDDTMGQENVSKTIVRALGQKCRDEVLSGLYLARSDVALIVRQAAGHVWKMVVSNTPRTLKELMRTLFEMVVFNLASSCEERQQMAARCLGELVRKMGEKIITEVMPVLEENLKSEEVEKRVGVAIALHEIIDNMSKEVLGHYMQSLVCPIKLALCDDSPAVRSEAAATFSVFFNLVGHDALDAIVSPLLETLAPGQDHILEGLCGIMKLNSRQMLPYLLPKLTKAPVNVHALCSLAAVAGDSLSRQLPRILDALIDSCKTNDQYDPMIDQCESVVVSVSDEEGVECLIEYLLSRARAGNVPSAVLLHTFVDKTSVPLNELADDMLPGLLQLYTAEHPQIVDHAILAMMGVASQLDQREMHESIALVKKQLNMMVASAKGAKMPGFAHPKALAPILPMLRESLLQGGVELKALAGETLGMVVSVAEPTALKAHVVNMTGPLIRVLGDRYPANVKLAIVSTLSQLLDKVDAMLRPFLPQLQSTFVKALQEPSSRAVRVAAGGALSLLLRIHPKPEPLVTELLKFLAGSNDQQLIESTLVSVRALVAGSVAKLSADCLAETLRVANDIADQPIDGASELDGAVTSAAGALEGEVLVRRTGTSLGEEKIWKEVESHPNVRVRVAKAVGVQHMCSVDPERVLSEASQEVRTVLAAMTAVQSDAQVAAAGCRALAHLLAKEGCGCSRDLVQMLAKATNHSTIDVRRVAAAAAGHFASKLDEVLDKERLKLLVPQLVNGTKEGNSTVRAAAELSLVYVFRMNDKATGTKHFEEYEASVENAAAKVVLAETLVVLNRVVRSGDFGLENMNNIATVN